ncbi:MAG: DUF1549 domain-containing protein [Verrucomicrobia bacterium]|nr:DUF1549 domain-containing protein [Verrucomicrobiota bacterium]
MAQTASIVRRLLHPAKGRVSPGRSYNGRAAVQLALLALLAAIVHGHGKLSPEQIAALPAPASHPVDFKRDIQPLLEQACVKCHGRGKQKGGFSIESQASFLKGADSGPVAVAGKSGESLLIETVSGLDPDNVMPQKGTKLTSSQVGLLRAWIDQGMNWPEDVSFGKRPPNNLHPRAVELPTATQNPTSQPIDRLMTSYWLKKVIQPPSRVDDRTFARRSHIDVLGIPPSENLMSDFLKDSSEDKRERWVGRLLANRQAYAAHWLAFWNDLLRNDYRGTGYIDSGRKQISTWLYEALVSNLRYDAFVRSLIHPTAETEGFSKGIVWRGDINASERPPMQAAQNIAQVFLGVNLKCASCHDSFINDWSLADAYGLASVYSDEPLELVECDKPTGRKAVVKFPYPEIGGFEPSMTRTQRTERLASLMTRKENGRTPRTLINRLWERLMGAGLVTSVDDMDQASWHPDLLDWLAEDFVANGHDIQRALRWILTSEAYQAPAVDLGEGEQRDFVFRGPGIRRLTAEQFRDSLGSLTGVWHAEPSADFDLATGGDTNLEQKVSLPPNTRWIWPTAGAATNATPGDAWFRKTISLTGNPTSGFIAATADDSYTLFVNGKEVIKGKDSKRAQFADLKPHLKEGDNLIAVQVSNAEKKEPKGAPSPAGLLVFGRIEAGATTMDIATDKTWLCRTNISTDWRLADYGADQWRPAAEVSELDSDPWKGKTLLTRAISMAAMHGFIRASLTPADPLASAMGRPPREQVVTLRSSAATTLQALEFANGETLSRLLKEGAVKWLSKQIEPGQRLAESILRAGLHRTPSESELRVATELLGEKPGKESVEDLLWAVTMLPEFQLIY